MKHILKLGFGLLAIVIVFTLLYAFWFMRGSSRPFPLLPAPNGYDDFIAAGNLLSTQTNDAYKMEVEPLRAFIATNMESLRLLQLGLTRTCSVHTTEFLTNNPALIADTMAIKRLAHLGLAAGRLAELEGRTNDASAAYITGVRFGNEISRGGFIFHRLVGVACETMARSRLAIVATNLNATEAAGIILALEKLEAEAVSWAEINDNERRYMRQAIRQSYYNPIMLVQSWWSVRSILKKAKVRHSLEIARRRLLLAELALRCHATAHGSPPKQLSDLVTEYITRIPLDPFTEQAFIYRSDGTNWLLYSVGADRVDSGGAPVGRAADGKPVSDDMRYDSK